MVPSLLRGGTMEPVFQQGQHQGGPVLTTRTALFLFSHQYRTDFWTAFVFFLFPRSHPD